MRQSRWLSGLFLVMALLVSGCVNEDTAALAVDDMASTWAGNGYSKQSLPFAGRYQYLVCTADGRLLYVKINDMGFPDVDDVIELRQDTVACKNLRAEPTSNSSVQPSSDQPVQPTIAAFPSSR